MVIGTLDMIVSRALNRRCGESRFIWPIDFGLLNETNLQRLLEGTKQYQIPLYQRTYAWGDEQLRRLWDDLVNLAEDRGGSAVPHTHFMGSLVLAPSPTIGPAGLQEFLVVDGQQRLTTLTLPRPPHLPTTRDGRRHFAPESSVRVISSGPTTGSVATVS